MQEIINQAKELAINEINKYSVPKIEHFILVNEKGRQLAETLGADKNIVLLGTMLMDLKIGQCMKEGRLTEHVKDSSLAAQEFLKQFDISDEVFKKIVSCIELHHGTENYYCLEAEICANSDCYKFLSPEGFFHALMTFGNRLLNFNEALTNLENKVDEKYNIISLDICRQEVEENYHIFKKLIKTARRV